jgi:hypothetical protein
VSIEKAILKPKEPAIDLIRIISEGTYTSFAQAIKEFISNAWDGDANNVRLQIDEDADRMVLRDDGIGMTVDDFTDYYASIARRGKSGSRSVEGKTRLGRRKIGRFGIGALAVAGVADQFTVRSTRTGRREGFECSIDLETVRRQFNRGKNLSDHWKFATTTWGDEVLSSHFTEVVIEGLRQDVKNTLLRVAENDPDEHFSSIGKLSGIEELRWRLGIICPVPYVKSLPIPEKDLDRDKDKIVFRLAGQLKKADFHVWLNDAPVARPIFLPSYEPNAKPSGASAQSLYYQRGLGYDLLGIDRHLGGIHYHGYLVSQAKQVFPEELRGILIRVRGVAVGWHRTLYLSVKGGTPALPSMSGELWVDGLDDSLQFDRESFRDDHPKYIEFVDDLSAIVNSEVNAYKRRSIARKQRERARKGVGKGKPEPTTQPQEHPRQATQVPARAPSGGPTDQFVASDLFEKCGHYIKNTVTQINGCWNHGYLEACAVMIRRLLQLLITDLYVSRGWGKELKDPHTNDYLGLKAIVNKVKGDARFGFDKRMGKWLDELKELGDIGAHDHTIRVRKHDLSTRREAVRYACERLIFYINKELTE